MLLLLLLGCTDSPLPSAAPPAAAPPAAAIADVVAGDAQVDEASDADADAGVAPDAQDVAGTDMADTIAPETSRGADAAAVADAGCLAAAACLETLGQPPKPCLQAACAEGNCSWQPTPVGAACDTDGLPCTVETCDAKGACQTGGLAAGQCGIVVDGKPVCFAKGAAEPKNPCLACDPDKATTAWSALAAGTTCGPLAKGCVQSLCSAQAQCEPVPSPSLCPKPATACKAAQCDVNFGCTAAALPAGATCEADILACTIDACDVTGACGNVSLNHAGCSDGVACTLDQCNPAKGCEHLPQVATCDDANVCTTDSCSYPEGCTHASVNVGCTDGLPCTAGDVCAAGACVAGKATLWSKPLADSGRVAGAIVHADGTLLIARDTVTLAGGNDVRLDKLTADGTLVWSKTYGSADSEQVNGLLARFDGATMLVGWRKKAGAVEPASSTGNLGGTRPGAREAQTPWPARARSANTT